MGKHRWTIMVIPHGSEALHSLSVSAGAARAAAWGAALLVLVLVVGLRTIATEASRLLSGDSMATASAAPPAAPDELVALRSRLATLDSVLDTIRSADLRLRDAVGAPVLDSTLLLRRARASTDSLLGHAATVVTGFGSLADSAAEAGQRRSASAATSSRRPAPARP